MVSLQWSQRNRSWSLLKRLVYLRFHLFYIRTQDLSDFTNQLTFRSIQPVAFLERRGFGFRQFRKRCDDFYQIPWRPGLERKENVQLPLPEIHPCFCRFLESLQQARNI